MTAEKEQTLTIQQAIDLAIQHHNAGDLPKAEGIYQQILQAEPNQPAALRLLGVIAHQVGKNDIAIDLITKAIAIKSDYAEAHSNLGNILSAQGKLDEAVTSYNKLLAIKPDHADCFINCESILVQVSEASSLDEKLKPNANKRLKSLLCEHPKHQILQSIRYFLKGDCEASKNTLINYKTLDGAGRIKDLGEKDQAFFSAYASFINHVIKKCPTLESFNKNKIYHVGESHCTSYAHHSFILEEQTFCVSPKITFGAKAYHFSKPKENFFYKSVTR